MTCTPAPACKAALNEATMYWPDRSRLSDGICASSQHHQQNPDSDHETGDAFDLTHDPANGCDVDVLFARIIERRDPRVKYLIRNRRILRSYDKPGIPAWTWATYTGTNPHVKHGHCSIVAVTRNDTRAWFVPTLPTPTPPPTEDAEPMTLYTPTDATGNTHKPDGSPIGPVVLVQGNKRVTVSSGKDYTSYVNMGADERKADPTAIGAIARLCEDV